MVKAVNDVSGQQLILLCFRKEEKCRRFITILGFACLFGCFFFFFCGEGGWGWSLSLMSRKPVLSVGAGRSVTSGL